MSSIITVSDLESYTGGPLDATRAALVVAGVNAHIERVTGRVWGETETVSETHDYAPVIFLRNMDVTAVTSIDRTISSESPTTLQASSYRWNDLGRVVLASRGYYGLRHGYDELLVNYQHGVTDVPDDLKAAALSLASGFYSFASDGDTEVSAERIGSYSVEYSRGDSSTGGSMYSSIIRGYRKAHV